jgi:hypothetical protein
MAEASGSRSDFKFILNSVQDDAVQAVAQELTALFPLDLPNALNIARNTPLILLDKLSPQQARTAGSYAIRLKALGADVQITAQPVGKLQVLRWPLLPDITKRPGNHVICPACGARLQVQVHAPVVEAAPEPAAPPLPEVMEPPPIPAAPIPVPVAPPLAPEPVAVAPAPAPPQPAAPPPPPAPAPAFEDDEEVILEPLDDDDDELVELVDDEVEMIEPAPAAPAPVGQPVGGGGSSRVTLVGKIRGKKKQAAAALMAHYRGISPEEAVLELGKTVVTVARDLTEDEAAQCQAEFADVGVKVKVRG